ncbi:hypothetical protein V1283_003441 [Bradyrhizobium sp. AZCC 2262]
MLEQVLTQPAPAEPEAVAVEPELPSREPGETLQ